MTFVVTMFHSTTCYFFQVGFLKRFKRPKKGFGRASMFTTTAPRMLGDLIFKIK